MSVGFYERRGLNVETYDARVAAEEQRMRLAPEAAARVRLVHSDMARFSVPERFGLAIAPFRSFATLLDPDVAVEGRSGAGGPSPSRVRAQADALEATLDH